MIYHAARGGFFGRDLVCKTSANFSLIDEALLEHAYLEQAKLEEPP
jgi:hypothetical protein